MHTRLLSTNNFYWKFGESGGQLLIAEEDNFIVNVVVEIPISENFLGPCFQLQELLSSLFMSPLFSLRGSHINPQIPNPD